MSSADKHDLAIPASPGTPALNSIGGIRTKLLRDQFCERPHNDLAGQTVQVVIIAITGIGVHELLSCNVLSFIRDNLFFQEVVNSVYT